MPVDLPSLRGKVDPDVERAIREIVIAVNKLEPLLAAGGVAGLAQQVAALKAAVERDHERIENVERRVSVLEQAP